MIITYFYLNCGVPIGSGIKAVPIGSGVKAVPIGSDVKAEPIGSGVEAVPIGSGVKAAPIGSGVKAAPIGRYLISRPTQHTQFIEIGGGGQRLTKIFLSKVAILILFIRRQPGVSGGEFGGPKWIKVASSLLLFCLWIVFVALAAMESYKIITPNF